MAVVIGDGWLVRPAVADFAQFRGERQVCPRQHLAEDSTFLGQDAKQETGVVGGVLPGAAGAQLVARLEELDPAVAC
jgi:hypothetical protein